MTLAEVRKFRNADPFRPFYVVLADGRKLLVKDRFHIGYSPHGTRVGIAVGGDAIETVSVREISRLEPAKHRGGKNGTNAGKAQDGSMIFTAVFQKVREGYIGFVEELPGANTQAATLKEARASLAEAVALVLEANRTLAEEAMQGKRVIREPLVMPAA